MVNLGPHYLHSGNFFELPPLLLFPHLLCGIVLRFSLRDTDLSQPSQSPDRSVANPRTCALCVGSTTDPAFGEDSKCWAEGDYCWARGDLIYCFCWSPNQMWCVSLCAGAEVWMGCGAEHLCFPSQQPRSSITSAIILLTAIISELFCFNRIIITYYLITVVLILQKHLWWEIK